MTAMTAELSAKRMMPTMKRWMTPLLRRRHQREQSSPSCRMSALKRRMSALKWQLRQLEVMQERASMAPAWAKPRPEGSWRRQSQGHDGN